MGAGLRDCSGILPGGIVLLHGLFDGILELLFYIRPVHADITKLRSRAPKLELTKDKDLIAVNNGIFDYRLKTLIPFSPKMVFLSKSSVDYNPKARNVIISNPDGTKWDVESWMQSLSGDPEIVGLLWQLLGAVIRPNVPWNKHGLKPLTLKGSARDSVISKMTYARKTILFCIIL